MPNKLLVRKAAVLGAGVMGAQIAAHLTNAGVDTVLFDLPAKEGHPDGIVHKAIANLAKPRPAPLASKALVMLILLAVIGLKHGRTAEVRDLEDQPLEVGDTLLVAGPWPAIRALGAGPDGLILLNLPLESDEVAPAAARARAMPPAGSSASTRAW